MTIVKACVMSRSLILDTVLVHTNIKFINVLYSSFFATETSGSIFFDTATKTVTMAEASQDNAAIKEKVSSKKYYNILRYM